MVSTFDFENMNLIPRKCIVDSRSECDTSIRFGPHRFKLPVVPANMECVIDEDIAEKLAAAGYFYVLHRFGVDAVGFAKQMRDKGLIVSISVGVKAEDHCLLAQLAEADLMPEYVTIDIAHGHAVRMEATIKYMKTFSKPPFIIAGNVSTAAAVRDLEEWGADAIKVGIGPGSACTTYVATGFGSRGIQASVIQEASAAVRRAVIVADGGIKEPGDIAKAFALGANMIMIGGMFSGLVDSPGAIVVVGDRRFKEFWGSASAAQGKTNRIEGTKKLIPLKDRTYLEEMTYITECLQSAISYAGGNTITALSGLQFLLKTA
jgi:GMP reductase